MAGPLSDEESEALQLLAKNRRLLVILVPASASDEFVARLTAWSNFCLDTKLLPPLWLATSKEGDGLVCPYCGLPSMRTIEGHAPDCEWAQAAVRWGGAQIQIDEEFGRSH